MTKINEKIEKSSSLDLWTRLLVVFAVLKIVVIWAEVFFVCNILIGEFL